MLADLDGHWDNAPDMGDRAYVILRESIKELKPMWDSICDMKNK